MNECTYLGRICTDLVLNKKAMDDKENYWTRFRLAVARKRVKKEGEKDTDFCVTLQNDMGFVLTEDRGLGAAILMADYAVVERRQGEIQILLTYSCESRNTR